MIINTYHDVSNRQYVSTARLSDVEFASEVNSRVLVERVLWTLSQSITDELMKTLAPAIRDALKSLGSGEPNVGAH